METSTQAGLPRSKGFRIVAALAQIVLGVIAGYLVAWGTMRAVLQLEVATGWTLPWLMDTWLVPVAVTVGLIAVAWVTLPKLRIALGAAAVSAVATSGFFLWIFLTW